MWQGCEGGGTRATLTAFRHVARRASLVRPFAPSSTPFLRIAAQERCSNRVLRILYAYCLCGRIRMPIGSSNQSVHSCAPQPLKSSTGMTRLVNLKGDSFCYDLLLAPACAQTRKAVKHVAHGPTPVLHGPQALDARVAPARIRCASAVV